MKTCMVKNQRWKYHYIIGWLRLLDILKKSVILLRYKYHIQGFPTFCRSPKNNVIYEWFYVNKSKEEPLGVVSLVVMGQLSKGLEGGGLRFKSSNRTRYSHRPRPNKLEYHYSHTKLKEVKGVCLIFIL